MHIGSLGIFEGGPLRDQHGRLRTDAVRSEIESRLHLVPKLRRRVQFLSLGAAAPSWVDDPHFDIANHVVETTLASPGTEEALHELCADLMSRPLKRDQPLWEIWLVDGLDSGQVALIEKLHHSMADGLAGVELVTVLFDLDRHPTRSHCSSSPWQPVPPPASASIVTNDLVRRAAVPLHMVSNGIGLVRHPLRVGREFAHYAEGIRTLLTRKTIAPSSSLNVQIGERRRMEVIRQPLGELHQVARSFRVTINDLLLTTVAEGIHLLMVSRGVDVEERTVQVLVPVGAEHHADHQLGNRVSAMLVRLPIGRSDPMKRLRSVAAAQASSKDHHQALAGVVLLNLAEPLSQPVVAAAAHLVHRQPFCNLIVTNVPGPDFPLYVLGARMLEAFPIVPLVGNLTVGVAILTYDGQLTVGLLADPDACPDLDVFADGIRHSLAKLVAANMRSNGGSESTLVERSVHRDTSS